MWNDYTRHDGLVEIYRTGPVIIGDVTCKNGVLIQNGFAIDESDSIIIGNAVIHHLHETIDGYTEGYIACAKYMSIESYIKRVKYLDGFECVAYGSDAYRALDKFYNQLESTITNKYASVGHKKNHQIQSQTVENDEDIIF